MITGGRVDGSVLRDFLSLAAVGICIHSFRAGFRFPAWLGSDSFAGASSAFHAFAPLGRRRDFHLVFTESPGRCRLDLIDPQLAFNFFPENSADDSRARNSDFSVGDL